jgi:hypothetical protein
VDWEHPAKDGEVPTGKTTWTGNLLSLEGGRTLVLSHRQQMADGQGVEGLEIYAFVTGWFVPAK